METRADDVRGRKLLRLAAIGAGVCVALGIAFGYSNRGYPIGFWGLFGLGLLVVAFLSVLLIVALIRLGLELSRRHFGLTVFLPPLVIVVGFVVGLGLPSIVGPRVPHWVENVFWSHHDEFVELAKWASAECAEGRDPDLPPAAFYEDASADCGSSGLEEIEFLLSWPHDFHYPVLLHAARARSQTGGDPCSVKIMRYLVEKIDDQWYVCLESTD